MFDKIVSTKITKDDVIIISNELVKTAEFKLPDGVEYDPEYFYMKVRGVSAGEFYGSNNNSDWFPEEELKKSFKTFLNAHTFKNHENKDIANAIGDVLSAEWDDKMKGVMLLIRIDRKVAPTIVRGFEKGFMTDVSMGCRIDHSICSICHNKAKTRDGFCDHIKTMRGQVFPDGRKVYEINIGPKFHDISAVLTGAEKVAKVVGIMIHGNKVAYIADEIEKTEKVASIQDQMEKVAFDQAQEAILDSLEIFESREKLASKKDYIQKIAEIKKEIQGRISTIAEGKVLSDREKSAEILRDILRLFHEKYWDSDKCKEIAEKIKETALRNETTNEEAFDQFLKTLNFAGIELTPFEFHEILKNVIGTEYNGNHEDFDDNQSFEDHGINESIPNLVRITKSILPSYDRIADVIGGENVVPKAKMVILTLRKSIPQSEVRIQNRDMFDDFMPMVSEHMPERSYHRPFLFKRMISMDGSSPIDNRHHFKFSSFRGIPAPLSSILYSTYQNERIASIDSNDFNVGMEKVSCYMGEEIEKIAKRGFFGRLWRGAKNTPADLVNFKNHLLWGIPITFGYSALQKARINNGENVSGVNKMIADYPESAYLTQLALGPALRRGAANLYDDVAHTVVNSKTKKALDSMKREMRAKPVKDFVKKPFSKMASEEYDMYKDESLNQKLGDIFGDEKVSALKHASVLKMMDREDLYHSTLAKHALQESDVEKYLDTCVSHFYKGAKEDLDKYASIIGAITRDTAIQSMFNKDGVSALSHLPGSVVDAAVFTFAMKKLMGDNKNKQKTNTIQNNIPSDIDKNKP